MAVLLRMLKAEVLFLVSVLAARLELRCCVVAISSSVLQSCLVSVVSPQPSIPQQLQKWEDNTMAACLFHATMEEQFDMIRKSQLWVGHHMHMNVSLLSSSSTSSCYEDEERMLRAEYLCNIMNAHGMSEQYMCAISMEDMVQRVASKLCATPHELEALRPSSNIMAAEGDEVMMVMMSVSQVESKGKYNSVTSGGYERGRGRSVVCHQVPPRNGSVYMCGCMENMEYIEVTLTNGDYEATAIAHCPSPSLYDDDDDDDMSCRWLIGDSTFVWVLKDAGSPLPSSSQQENTATTVDGWIANQKSRMRHKGEKKLGH